MRLHKIALIFVALVTVASCAKLPSEDFNLLERESLDAWMKLYHPDVERLPSGVYIERIDTNHDGLSVEVNNWVMINYNGTNLDGDVYCTRYKSVAEIVGSYSNKTYYAPQYLKVNENSYGMIQAQYDAIRSMNAGDSVHLYIPSSMGYGAYQSNFSGGYQGQFVLGPNSPSILHLKLEKVVKDPVLYEEGLVDDYATKEHDDWKKDQTIWTKMNLNDTLKPHMYFQKVKTVAETEENLIGEDTSLNVYYKGYFIDGFVFDTNMDSVALRVWDSWAINKPIVYKPADKSTMIEAFYYAIIKGKMRKEETARFIFTSQWGYGAEGRGTIPQYKPMIFEIYVESSKTKK